MANDHTLVEQRGQPVVQGAKETEEEEEEVARMEVCLSKIPPGYRFLPEDGELIKDYLMPKVNKKPLPMNRIRSVAFYRYCPDVLIGKRLDRFPFCFLGHILSSFPEACTSWGFKTLITLAFFNKHPDEHCDGFST